MDVVKFFKSLKPEDWSRKVTEKWTVKDVLSHLVGWHREVVIELRNTFEKEIEHWFMKTDDYTEFNDKIYNEFKDRLPEELLIEFEKWEKSWGNEVKNIGEDKIKQRKHTSWVFDEDEGDEPHFEHHINQIKKALNIH